MIRQVSRSTVFVGFSGVDRTYLQTQIQIQNRCRADVDEWMDGWMGVWVDGFGYDMIYGLNWIGLDWKMED